MKKYAAKIIDKSTGESMMMLKVQAKNEKDAKRKATIAAKKLFDMKDFAVFIKDYKRL